MKKESSEAVLKNLGRSLNDDLDSFLGQLREKLSDESLVQGQIDELNVLAQRRIFRLIDRIRAVKNSSEMLESIMEGSSSIRALKGIIGRMFQFLEDSSSREDSLFLAREVDIWKTIERGGTKKDKDAIARSKDFMRDAQAGGEEII